jgi:hypothetical protein
LLILGLSASGTASDIIYRVASALWLASGVSFSVFAFRLNRAVAEVSERSMFRGISGVFVLAFLPVAGLQAANAAVLGLFWPVFVALFYQLLSATNSFYRLIFLGAR